VGRVVAASSRAEFSLKCLSFFAEPALSAKGKLIGVGKRGSIIIPAEKVAELEIGKDDKFTVRKTKAGIALKKV
jgi:hypothetical protein